jgi:dephospho-CoA kinase
VNRRPYVIGLTGNIATGKSLVGRMLSELGAEYIDADRLAHQVIARGTPAWEQIVAAFGLGVLEASGNVDRGRLGAIVFSDPGALARLEAIVHPDVIAYTRRLLSTCKVAAVVVEAIKLIESGMAQQLCDTVWVVVAPRAVQIRRLVEERGMSDEDAALRVDAQPPQEAKIAQAEVIIDNSSTPDATQRQVQDAWSNVIIKSQSIPAR